MIPGYILPLLLCDVNEVDHTLIGWADQYSSYDSHNIISDIPKIAKANNAPSNSTNTGRETPIFSIVKSWDPIEPSRSEHEKNEDNSQSLISESSSKSCASSAQ